MQSFNIDLSVRHFRTHSANYFDRLLFGYVQTPTAEIYEAIKKHLVSGNSFICETDKRGYSHFNHFLFYLTKKECDIKTREAIFSNIFNLLIEKLSLDELAFLACSVSPDGISPIMRINKLNSPRILQRYLDLILLLYQVNKIPPNKLMPLVFLPHSSNFTPLLSMIATNNVLLINIFIKFLYQLIQLNPNIKDNVIETLLSKSRNEQTPLDYSISQANSVMGVCNALIRFAKKLCDDKLMSPENLWIFLAHGDKLFPVIMKIFSMCDNNTVKQYVNILIALDITLQARYFGQQRLFGNQLVLARSSDGRLAIHNTLKSNNEDIVKEYFRLENHFLDLNQIAYTMTAITKKGYNCLHEIGFSGNIAILSLFISRMVLVLGRNQAFQHLKDQANFKHCHQYTPKYPGGGNDHPMNKCLGLLAGLRESQELDDVMKYIQNVMRAQRANITPNASQAEWKQQSYNQSNPLFNHMLFLPNDSSIDSKLNQADLKNNNALTHPRDLKDVRAAVDVKHAEDEKNESHYLGASFMKTLNA